MADVLEAPDAPFRLTNPIQHVTEMPDGTLLVHCVVTDETPDLEGEIVDYDAAKAAAPGMMEWATLGEMHDPDRMDAGTVLKLYFDDAARRIEADLHVVDPVAVRKVLSRTYKAVSIGGVKGGLRPTMVAGRVVKRITRLMWDELSLANRGANPNSLIAKTSPYYVLAKRAPQENDMTELDAGTKSPMDGTDAGADEPATPQQAAIDATREALAKGAPPFEGAKAPFGGKAKAKKAKKSAKAKKAAAVVVVPDAHDEPDGDDADDAEPVAKAAKAKPTREQRMAKRVKSLRKANRRLAKAGRRLRKRAGLAGLTRTLAKAGARNSGKDSDRIAKIHDLTTALGFDKCMTKAAPTAAETVAAEAPLAKAGNTIDTSALMREALAGIVPAEKLDAMMTRLAAIDERSRAQDEVLAKIAKSPSGGGPATPFAAVMRGQAGMDDDRGSVLAKAAEAIDDPRLKTQVSEAAALEMIRSRRGA